MARIYKTLFIMNVISLYISLFFLFYPLESVRANLGGLFILLTLTLNILAAVTRDRFRKTSVFYLVLSSFGLFAVMVLNTLASLDPSNGLSRSTPGIVLMLLHFIIGAAVSLE
ncbi:MAG: hypothetical protein ABS873_01995, partial [Alkalibacterium sp.]